MADPRGHNVGMRVVVRVTPGARTTRVGGRYGSGEPPVLAVRVTARAIDGKANAAVVAAIAEALQVPTRTVRVVAGRAARIKHLEISAEVTAAVRRLLEP